MSSIDKLNNGGASQGARAAVPAQSPLAAIQSGLFDDVEVALTVHLGQSVMTVAEVCALKADSIVRLDVRLNEMATVQLNGKPIARGEIVAVDDHFGLRITEIAPADLS